MKDYYKAYEDRYRIVHSKNKLWGSSKSTKEVIDIINKYNISSSQKILEVGCGEGRDVIYLLNNGYDVVGIDYSKSAIAKCNEITNNRYKDRFISFDIMNDKLSSKFYFIYSIAVIHMFLDDEDRNNFYKFIYEHLENDGIALIISMGDGESNFKSEKKDAYKLVYRTNLNDNSKIKVTSTSCRVVDMNGFINEAVNNNFKVIDKCIIKDVPHFNSCMMMVLRK